MQRLVQQEQGDKNYKFPKRNTFAAVIAIKEDKVDKESESEFAIRLHPSKTKVKRKLSPLRLNLKASISNLILFNKVFLGQSSKLKPISL